MWFIRDRKKNLKDLLGTNEQIGRTLVSSWLAINSNREGTEYNRALWVRVFFTPMPAHLSLFIRDNMIYKALVAFTTNEMPASLYLTD